VVVRVGCEACKRYGSYRLARLAAKYGAEISLDELMENLTQDCVRRGDRRKRSRNDPDCYACFIDLERPPRPPDLPPRLQTLRVIRGGRTDAA